MPEESHSTSYRIEVRERDLTSVEVELVAERARAWEDARRKGKDARKAARWKWAGVKTLELTIRLFLPVGIGVALWRQNELLAIAAFAVGALLAFLTLRPQRRRRRNRLASGTDRGPWGAPAGSWKVRETHVLARSVVRVPTGDEDAGTFTYLLFEIPGGDWFHLAPDGDAAEELARADLVMTQLWPDGPTLAINATGERLPIVGASEDPAAYDAEIEAGRTWRPERKRWEDRYDARVREQDLPPWVLESVGRRARP